MQSTKKEITKKESPSDLATATEKQGTSSESESDKSLHYDESSELTNTDSEVNFARADKCPTVLNQEPLSVDDQDGQEVNICPQSSIASLVSAVPGAVMGFGLFFFIKNNWKKLTLTLCTTLITLQYAKYKGLISYNFPTLEETRMIFSRHSPKTPPESLATETIAPKPEENDPIVEGDSSNKSTNNCGGDCGYCKPNNKLLLKKNNQLRKFLKRHFFFISGFLGGTLMTSFRKSATEV